MKDVFYNWVFHFNPYTNQWAAIPRDLYNQYWDDYELEGIIRSSKFSTLLEIIQKTEGEDIEKKLKLD
jgi:hypothetical protein